MKKLVRNCNPIFIEMKEIFLVVFFASFRRFFHIIFDVILLYII